MIVRPYLSVCTFLVVGVVAAIAQQIPAGQAPANTTPAQLPTSIRPDYVLGPNDQILVRAPQADEINERPFRIDSEGFITLPIVGRIRAAGSTVQALEADLVMRLREFIREPQVIISVTQFRSEPVFFTGAFRNPGLYPLQGRRTLIEMLTAVGGLQPNASRRIRITRRAEYGPIPLSNAALNPITKTSTVEISMESLTQNVNPDEDIVLQAYDIVNADRAERVYVSGDVTRSAAIELGERDSVSVAQAITEAGGFTQYASRDKVRVLRPILGTTRRAEIEIDMKRVFEGKDIDFPLLANDVLYVPRAGKRAFFVPLGTGLLTSLPSLLIGLAASGGL